MGSFSTFALLAFGFALGLKHAVEADHLAAVSTIVTQRKSPWSASIVGGLWGVGHTISLFAAAIVVLAFHFEISHRVEQTLEFCVGLMLIVLGIDAFRRIIKGGQVHMHSHKHGAHAHFHPHQHEADTSHAGSDLDGHDHQESRIGIRPVIVGMIHGLAGSGALMLIVLATVSSPIVGVFYVIVFGVGSIAGMMLMSLLLGLPTYFTARKFSAVSRIVRIAAAAFSIGLGIQMSYEIAGGGLLFG